MEKFPRSHRYGLGQRIETRQYYWADSGSAYVFDLSGLVSPCPGDLDGDGDTGQADLGILLADWGCEG